MKVVSPNDVKINIILPTRNRSNFLKEAIESITKQTYEKWELIIIDDGSTDNTKEVVSHYQKKYKNIQYFYIHPSGASIARNKGIQKASGKYIAFQDDDDIWLPDNLKLHIDFLEKYPEVDFAFADITLFGETHFENQSWMKRREVFRKIPLKHLESYFYKFECNIFKYLLKERFITIPTLMVKKDCFKQVKFELSGKEDYDLFLQLARYFQGGYINKILAKCRVHQSNTHANIERNLKTFIILFQKWLNLCNKEEQNIIKSRYPEIYFNAGYSYFRMNDFLRARKYFKQSLKYKSVNKSLIYYTISFLPLNTQKKLRKIKNKLKFKL